MKKRIKNKHLPKFDFSGDLSSINRAKSATATVTGPTVPLANGLTQQASDNLSFDSGLSSTPNFGMSTKTGNIIGGVGRGIGAMSSFIPEDNDGHGVSRTGQKISSGIQKGMDTAGEVASSFGPMGQAVGGVLKLGSFLVKGFTALADAVKEQRNPKDEKWDKQYNVVNPNASKLDFGNSINELPRNTVKDFSNFENGGYINDSTNTSTDQVLSLDKFKNSVPDYIYKGYLNSGIEKGGLYENINKLQFPVMIRQLQDGSYTYLPYTYENVHDNSKNTIQLLENKKKTTQTKIYSLGGIPPNEADIEAEKKEAMLYSDNTIKNIGGKVHEKGGTPLTLEGDEEYIFSDRLGYDKKGLPTINIKDVSKSFADKAKSIERKYKAKHDLIAEKTKELEINTLIQDAEQARQLKEQVDMSKDVRKMQAKYGKDLRKFANSGAPNELSGDTYSQWSNLFYNNSGMYPDANMYTGLTNQPNMNTGIGMFQNWVKDRDKTMLPKYGIDGKWGPESQNAWTKHGAEYLKLISDSPSKGVGITNTPTAGTTINAPLFTGNLPSGPQQDMNGIDIEAPGDNYGAGIGVYGKQPSTGRNGLFKNLTTGDKLGLASMLPGTLYNFAMGLKPAEKEKFYTNPYQNEIVGLMQNRRFDAQPFINEATMANQANNQNISDNASSIGVKLANMQKAQANYINSLASITGKAQEINNNYRAEEAQVKNNLGEVLRQEGIRQAGVNAQNKAAKQAFMAKTMTQLGQDIAAVGQASNQSLTNTILAKSLSELSPDFDVKKLKDLYDRGQVDESGYFTFNGAKYQYIPSQNGRAEDGQVVKVTQDLGLPINKKTLYPPMTFTTTTTKKGK